MKTLKKFLKIPNKPLAVCIVVRNKNGIPILLGNGELFSFCLENRLIRLLLTRLARVAAMVPHDPLSGSVRFVFFHPWLHDLLCLRFPGVAGCREPWLR